MGLRIEDLDTDVIRPRVQMVLHTRANRLHVTPPLPPRRRWRQQRTRGALLSSDDYGSSVERTATLHPLWQGLLSQTAARVGGSPVELKEVRPFR